MSIDNTNHGPFVGRGQVKWFDPIKGYGFVDATEQIGEILMHGSLLRDYGLSSIAKGVEVEFEFEQSSKGARITKIINVTQDDIAFSISELDDADFDRLEPAIVKWYDTARGFGFMRLFKSSEEVFFHSAILQKSGMANVIAGAGYAILVDRSADRPVVQHIFEWAAVVQP